MKKALGNTNLKLALFTFICIALYFFFTTSDIGSREWINSNKEKSPDSHVKKALSFDYNECLKSLTPHDCFNEVIQELTIVDECEKFPDYMVYGKPVRDNCIFSFVEKTSDFKLCFRIENSAQDRDSCLAFVFFQTNDNAICDVMELSESRANCYANVRINDV